MQTAEEDEIGGIDKAILRETAPVQAIESIFNFSTQSW